MLGKLLRLKSDSKQTLGRFYLLDGLVEVFKCVVLELPDECNERRISNIPAAGLNKFLEILTTANSITDNLLLPAYWDKDPSSDDFIGDIENRIMVDCIDGDAGARIIKYRIQNLD